MPQSYTHDSYGQELARIRLTLNLTQPEFAKQLGVTINTVSRYERGDRQIPEPTMRLARSLLPKSGPHALPKDWTPPVPGPSRGKGRPRRSPGPSQGDQP